MDKLTDKQEAFCKEYLIDFNATQAAIRAGYSEKTAYNAGWQNVNKCEIQERLTELKNKIFSVKRQLENVYGNRNVLKK